MRDFCDRGQRRRTDGGIEYSRKLDGYGGGFFRNLVYYSCFKVSVQKKLPKQNLWADDIAKREKHLHQLRISKLLSIDHIWSYLFWLIIIGHHWKSLIVATIFLGVFAVMCYTSVSQNTTVYKKAIDVNCQSSAWIFKLILGRRDFLMHRHNHHMPEAGDHHQGDDHHHVPGADDRWRGYFRPDQK